jgi:hypothetical protein
MGTIGVGVPLKDIVLLLGGGNEVVFVGTEILNGAQTMENKDSNAIGLLVSLR